MVETSYAYFPQNGTLSVRTAASSGGTAVDFPVAAIQGFSVESSFEVNDLYGWNFVTRLASARYNGKVEVKFTYVKFVNAELFQNVLNGSLELPSGEVGIGNTTSHYYFDFVAKIPDSTNKKLLNLRVTDVYFSNVPLGGELGEWMKLELTGTGSNVYTKVNDIVNIKYDANGGTGSFNDVQSLNKYIEGDTFTLAGYDCGFAKTGYVISKWLVSYNDSAETTELDAYSSITIPASTTKITIKPKWTAAYTVTFNSNGGSGTMAQVSATGTYTLPANGFTAPTGKKFSKWSVTIGTAAAVEKNVGDTITISANTIVKALWIDA